MSVSRDFARRVKRERIHRKLSQNALERLAGISVGQVNRIESGVRAKEVSLDTAYRLARALGMSLDELVTGHGPPPGPEPRPAPAEPGSRSTKPSRSARTRS